LVAIGTLTRGTLLARRAALGITFGLKLRGLMFRREFGPFDGLWLAPTSEIHMFWVRFAIDLVWLDESLRVVEVTPGIRPWRVKRVALASSVVELPSGTAAATGTVPGDRIVLGDVAGVPPFGV
jgi:uncharacterized membrane protein (UPF0127 family)